MNWLVWVISWILRGLFMTLRPVFVQPEFLENLLAHAEQPFLVAVWHGRMLYLLQLYRYYRPGRVAVLVSQSRDGEWISHLLAQFGIHTSRGSSSRGGSRGLLALMKKASAGYQAIVFTPDGPRGPRYTAQAGIIAMASKTGAPIVPMAYSARWRKVCASWDQFLIPLPFSRIVVVCGEPLYVPAQSDATMLHDKQRELEHRLRHITTVADEYFTCSSAHTIRR